MSYIDMDYKELFELWLEFDSFQKVSNNLAIRDIINKSTNKPFNARSLQRVTWRYVLDNPEEALSIARSKGRDISDEYWEQFIVRQAYAYYVSTYHSRVEFYAYLRLHNLYDKYNSYRRIDPKPIDGFV